MPKIIQTKLNKQEVEELTRICKYSADWRERERAQTILLLSKGLTVEEVAQEQELCAATVRTTRHAWFRCQRESLCDKPRIGAPLKISQTYQDLMVKWAKESPLSAYKIQEKLIEQGGLHVHVTTIRRILRVAGLTWKRTRLSLREKCDKEEFYQAKQELIELQQRAKEGEIDLAYADESGFDQVSPTTYAWSLVGQEHRHEIAAHRGSRINVIAALFSNGTVAANFSDKSMKAADVGAFLKELAENLKKPLVIVLDNASIHKSKENKVLIEALEKKNLHLYFLPPYSPELNRIERFWHKIKYTWLVAKRRTKEELRFDLASIFTNFGSSFNFCFYT